MADGFTQGLALEANYPYPHPMNRNRIEIANGGACDPSMPDTRERLTPMRFATAFIRGTMAGAGSPIVFPATSFQLFTQGPTDTPSATVGTLAKSDTNAQPGPNGGLAKQNQMFVATALWFQFEQPYTVLRAAASAGPTRTGSAFLRSPVSPYAKVCAQMLASVINPQVQNGKQAACTFDFGALDLYAQGSGVADASIGFGGVGGSFYQMAVPQVSGGNDSGQEFQMNLQQDRTIEIESDAANATPGAAVDVIVPLRAIIMGYPVCANPGATGVDLDAVVDRVVQRLGSGGIGGDLEQMIMDKIAAKQGGMIRRR